MTQKDACWQEPHGDYEYDEFMNTPPRHLCPIDGTERCAECTPEDCPYCEEGEYESDDDLR